MTMTSLSPALSTKLCMLRGVRFRCPNCGEGKLFRAYLKQVDNCAVCGAALGQIRADDFPTWATVILTGHVLLPIAFFSQNFDLPILVQLGLWLPLTLGITLALLPRCKGAIIGLMWAMGGSSS
jgi:uncharacterized protein (DUF983 family)